MQNPKCEMRPLFHSFGGFLNDVKPNLVSELPVISMPEPSWGVHPAAGCPGATGLCSPSQASSSPAVAFSEKLMDRFSPTGSFSFSLESHSPAQNEWPEDITEPLFLPGSGPAQAPDHRGPGPHNGLQAGLPSRPSHPALPLPSSHRNHIPFSRRPT